ncbi:MAG: hypothetical protein CVU06_00490 [Bacteroidetes bacterium HGW-Bacteroidetes-22]|nr:MAG: hypothetical protein CVU06_00490 [Bacteroidetes bacterium HGW-Bacteroidetes-22]
MFFVLSINFLLNLINILYYNDILLQHGSSSTQSDCSFYEIVMLVVQKAHFCTLSFEFLFLAIDWIYQQPAAKSNLDKLTFFPAGILFSSQFSYR